MASTTLTDPSTIFSDTTSAINALDESMLSLNESCIIYNNLYENYITATKRDGSILKAKMKKAIAKAAPNELQ